MAGANRRTYCAPPGYSFLVSGVPEGLFSEGEISFFRELPNIHVTVQISHFRKKLYDTRPIFDGPSKTSSEKKPELSAWKGNEPGDVKRSSNVEEDRGTISRRAKEGKLIKWQHLRGSKR